MATLTIRNIDKPLKGRLRVRAALNGRSMEAEVRDILQSALPSTVSKETLVDVFRDAFEPLGGVDLHLDERRADRGRDPPAFD